MKKKHLILIGVLGLLALGTASTLAATTVRTRTTNIITTGSVNVALVQKTIADNGVAATFTPMQLLAITPGTRYPQMPYAQNTGTEDCYVRVGVQTKIIAADGETILPNVLELDIDESQWVRDDEGWYRYVDILESGEETAVPLFTSVSFPFSMDNQYLGATMELTLAVQGVQAEYNQYETSVLEVQGFPESNLVEDSTSSEEGST